MFNQFKAIEVPAVIRPNSPTFNEVYALIKAKMEEKEKVRADIERCTEELSNNNSTLRKVDMEMQLAGHTPYVKNDATNAYWNLKIPLYSANGGIEANIRRLEDKITILDCDINQMIMVLQLVKEAESIRANNAPATIAENPENMGENARRERRGSKG